MDLDPNKLLDIPQTPGDLARALTMPGIIARVEDKSEGDSTLKPTFSFDEDSLLWQLKDWISPKTEVVYIGSLKVEIDASEQEEVAQKHLEDYNCVPTFLPRDFYKKKSITVGFVNINCGHFFITCFPCARIMLTGFSGKRSFLQIKYF